jgi:hypothetical protein
MSFCADMEGMLGLERRLPESGTAARPCVRKAGFHFISVSGALWGAGTTADQDIRIWEDATPDDGSTGVGKVAPANSGVPVLATAQAISRLRRLSGLTWRQLADMFGVSRRSVHFWSSGKPLSASNEAHVRQALDVVQGHDGTGARDVRGALLHAVNGMSAYHLLAEQRFDDARKMLANRSVSAPRIPPAPLSEQARKARAPAAPGTLLDAMHDSIHEEVGRSRSVRPVRRLKSRE